MEGKEGYHSLYQCTTQEFRQKIEQKISEKFENISTEPIYADEISEESLEIANSITFGIFFCSTDVKELKFYQELFENSTLEKAVKALARILSVANQKKLMIRYHNTARVLFDKTTKLMNLRNKDIAVLTTAVSELESYPDLRNHKVIRSNISQETKNSLKVC